LRTAQHAGTVVTSAVAIGTPPASGTAATTPSDDGLNTLINISKGPGQAHRIVFRRVANTNQQVKPLVLDFASALSKAVRAANGEHRIEELPVR
jgi:hypothetical protein